MAIKIDNVAAEIVLAVTEYTEAVSKGVLKEIDTTSKKVLADIKANSPVGSTGKYKKGWKRKKEGGTGQVKYTIHNASKPWLAHLLEKGHAKRGGGRVRAIPHIKPAYDKHVPEMEQRIERIIKNGG